MHKPPLLLHEEDWRISTIFLSVAYNMFRKEIMPCLIPSIFLSQYFRNNDLPFHDVVSDHNAPSCYVVFKEATCKKWVC